MYEYIDRIDQIIMQWKHVLHPSISTIYFCMLAALPAPILGGLVKSVKQNSPMGSETLKMYREYRNLGPFNWMIGAGVAFVFLIWTFLTLVESLVLWAFTGLVIFCLSLGQYSLIDSDTATGCLLGATFAAAVWIWYPREQIADNTA